MRLSRSDTTGYNTPQKRASLILPALVCGLSLVIQTGCQRDAAPTSAPASRPAQLSQLGSVEVTATLVEIPGLEEYDGDFPSNDLGYDYTYIVKYRVEEVHRGDVEGDTILVGHYNPLIPRDRVADKRCPDIGGDVRRFRVGDLHRMALEVPIDDYYMGPMFNKYIEETMKGEPVYWSVWVIQADR